MDTRLEPQNQRRLLILTGLLAGWSACVAGRLLHLQVICHDDLVRQANQQQEKTVKVPARRGTIFDRAGEPLAMSLPEPTVAVNPLQLASLEFSAQILASTLHLDYEDLLAKLKDAKSKDRGFLVIKKRLPDDEAQALRSLQLNWVQWDDESYRSYPNGPLAAHVVGGVYGDQSGSSGVEQSMDDELTGQPGVEQLLTDVYQRGINSKVIEEPKPGKDITLTIDRQIQHVAEREIRAAVEGFHDVKYGTIVVMRPTGEVLAMASFPGFDPNELVKPGDDPQARNNQTITTPFEPGSVFKIVTLSAALQTTRLTPDTVVNCGSGSYNFFGRTVHDTHSYGMLPMSMVLAKSSNIGAIQIGLRVGDQNLLDYVRKFGFGKPTGIPLPGESGGLVRRLEHWTKTSIASVAMGQEVSTTSLQLARACSVFANGGYLVTPKLIVRKQRPGGPAEVEPDKPAVRILAPETAITMRKMMEGVVLVGTGKNARLKGYSSGGKTGTAQIFDMKTHTYTHKYNASFVGFAPVNNPAIVIAVTMTPSSAMGGTISGPVFNRVATEALRILDVPRDLPDDFVPPRNDTPVDDVAIADLDDKESDSRISDAVPGSPDTALVRLASSSDQRSSFTQTKSVVVGPAVPDFRGQTVRYVLQQTSSLGLPVEVRGSGIAKDQSPAPGSILAAGEKVRIYFVR